MIHKIYIIHFLKADIKTIPLFLPTNKKYVKKTDIKIAKIFYPLAFIVIGDTRQNLGEHSMVTIGD